MTPDIEQHLELLVGILGVTLALLHRLLKRRSVSLVLTVSDTEQSTNDSRKNTLECHSGHYQRKHTKRLGEEDNAE